MATVERPWLDNVRRISCIPEGSYTVKAYSSQKFPDVWQVMDVPGRDYILIHAGNTSNDVIGCIAVGLYRVKGEEFVAHSRDAISELRKILPEEFKLNITRHVEEYP